MEEKQSFTDIAESIQDLIIQNDTKYRVFKKDYENFIYIIDEKMDQLVDSYRSFGETAVKRALKHDAEMKEMRDNYDRLNAQLDELTVV